MTSCPLPRKNLLSKSNLSPTNASISSPFSRPCPEPAAHAPPNPFFSEEPGTSENASSGVSREDTSYVSCSVSAARSAARSPHARPRVRRPQRHVFALERDAKRSRLKRRRLTSFACPSSLAGKNAVKCEVRDFYCGPQPFTFLLPLLPLLACTDLLCKKESPNKHTPMHVVSIKTINSYRLCSVLA